MVQEAYAMVFGKYAGRIALIVLITAMSLLPSVVGASHDGT